MSDEHEMTNPFDASEESFAEQKGKGKATAEDVPESHSEEDEEDDDDDEEEEDGEAEGGQVEDDGLEEINLDNIVQTRTRGTKIDFAKAADEIEPEDEDDEDDDDFEPPNEDTEMAD